MVNHKKFLRLILFNMSFFYDDLSAFNVKNLGENLSIHYIENNGLVVVGNIKIMNFSETEIYLKKQKNIIKVFGENLLIKTMSKGEIVVEGKILNIDFGDKNVK